MSSLITSLTESIDQWEKLNKELAEDSDLDDFSDLVDLEADLEETLIGTVRNKKPTLCKELESKGNFTTPSYT